MKTITVLNITGHATIHAATCWLLIMEGWVISSKWHCGIFISKFLQFSPGNQTSLHSSIAESCKPPEVFNSPDQAAHYHIIDPYTTDRMSVLALDW
jgi:hypothetical protein